MESSASLDARILIIDDSAANITLLDLILRQAGYYAITSTTDPRQALHLFTSAAPDIVILDLLMPEMDGFAVLEHLRRLHVPASLVPVLVITADGTPDARLRALSSGASDFLIKPFSRTELLLRLRTLLEVHGRAGTDGGTGQGTVGAAEPLSAER